MIELAHGQNHFQLSEHVQGLIKKYRDEHGVDSVVQLDALETDWNQLHQAVTGMSLFASDEFVMLYSSSISDDEQICGNIFLGISIDSKSSQDVVNSPNEKAVSFIE